MLIRALIESEYAGQTEALAASENFQALKAGRAAKEEYDAFIANLCRTHLKSPQILAFLYSVSAPSAAEQLKHNLLEELGLDEEGINHPRLLLELAEAAGFDAPLRARLEADSQEELRRMCADPLLFGTLKELGLAVLLEVTCFEWMLSRLAKSMALLLEAHRGLRRPALRWFYHHSELDRRHAEEGLDACVDYAEHYGFEEEDLRSIVEITFRENVFLKRYFDLSVASHQELLASL